MRTNNPEDDKTAPLITNTKMIPVPVIASYTADGKIRPLYFSLEDLQIKIDNVKWQDNRMVSNLKFRCEITLSDRVEEIDLFFFRNECIWTMQRKGDD